MKDIDKIIEYMKLKQKLSIPEYLHPEDIRELENIPPAKAKRIWKEISFLTMSGRFSGMDCPFCSLVRSCNECSYGKHHFTCSNYKSTWKKVTKVIKYKQSSSEYTKKSITKKLDDLVFYLNIHLEVK